MNKGKWMVVMSDGQIYPLSDKYDDIDPVYIFAAGSLESELWGETPFHLNGRNAIGLYPATRQK